MPAPAFPVSAVRIALGSVSLLASLACAALAVWALVNGRPLLAVWPLLGLGSVAGLLVGLWTGRRTLAHAAAAMVRPPPLARADLQLVELPPLVPAELRPLADGIRALLARQQALFDVQAEQLEALRRLAHSDPLTGLANRRHFMAMLDAVLDTSDTSEASQANETSEASEASDTRSDIGLLLLRVQDLQGLNQRVGRAAADRALLAVAESLQTYPDRISRCFAGRLNGADFALLLPVGGMAQETAAALAQAMRLTLAAIDPGSRAHVGAVELTQPMAAAQAMALADAALARAEAGGVAPPAPAVATLQPLDIDLSQGESGWHRRITRALAQGWVALAAYPVRTADARQLHLDCPLRLQLRSGGPMEPASRWLDMANRSRLCAEVDEHVVALALQAIVADGQARCINVAAQSLAADGFMAAVAQRLARAPAAACRLWIDLPESLALAQPLLVREAARCWRPLGVMLGLEHAGEGLARIPGLINLGLDCVRIDSRFVNGITGAGAEDARRHLQGLVKLVQAVGLQVTAEGVRSADDLEALWQLGFDAAAGPALLAEVALTV